MFRREIITILVLFFCAINNFDLSYGARPSKARRQLDLNETNVEMETTTSNNEIIEPPTAADVKTYMDQFDQCQRGTKEYNECVAKALNWATRYFRTGVPELNMPIIEPLNLKEASTRRTDGPIPFKVKLTNITEDGWSTVKILSFRGDKYPKEFHIEMAFAGPKITVADYEFEAPLLPINRIKGKLLNLFTDGLRSSMTFKRLKDNSIRADFNVIRLEDMKVNITISGNPALENFANNLINSPIWRAGFQLMRPFINEVVTSGATLFSNSAADNFVFNKLLPVSTSQK